MTACKKQCAPVISWNKNHFPIHVIPITYACYTNNIHTEVKLFQS